MTDRQTNRRTDIQMSQKQSTSAGEMYPTICVESVGDNFCVDIKSIYFLRKNGWKRFFNFWSSDLDPWPSATPG